MNWMLDKINEHNADGVAFYTLTAQSFGKKEYHNGITFYEIGEPVNAWTSVIKEYTRKQIEEDGENLPYPKTFYFFWKEENGKKIPIIENKKS